MIHCYDHTKKATEKTFETESAENIKNYYLYKNTKNKLNVTNDKHSSNDPNKNFISKNITTNINNKQNITFSKPYIKTPTFYTNNNYYP